MGTRTTRTINYDAARNQLQIAARQGLGPVGYYAAIEDLADGSMKMKHEADIHASRDFVWATFDNPGMLSKWQPTLESFTHQAGEPGQPGAVSELVYDENGKMIVRTETITERREPQFLAGKYDSAWATTLIVNYFEEIDEKTTRFVSYTNMKFKGVMKIMALFVARSIRARAEADLNRFKLLVETEAAGLRQ